MTKQGKKRAARAKPHKKGRWKIPFCNLFIVRGKTLIDKFVRSLIRRELIHRLTQENLDLKTRLARWESDIRDGTIN